MSTIENIRKSAVLEFAKQIESGETPEKAIQNVWRWLKKEHFRRLRAPNAFRAFARNTTSRKSYRSPIGEALEIHKFEFGHHSGKWPQTNLSKATCEFAKQYIIDWFLTKNETLKN